MKSYSAKKPDENSTEKKLEKCSMPKEKLPITDICASSALDAILRSEVELKISIPLARCEGADYVSEKTTGTDLPPEIQVISRLMLHCYLYQECSVILEQVAARSTF